MSYILEALKKSDKERQQGSVPDIQSRHTIYPGLPYRQKKAARKRRKIALVGLVTVAALIVVVLYRSQDQGDVQAPSQMSESETSTPSAEIQQTVIPRQLDSSDRVVIEQVDNEPPPQLAQPRELTETAPEMPPTPHTSATTEPVVIVREARKIIVEPAPIVVREDAPPAAKATTDIPPTAETNVPFLKDLPPAFQESIPELSLAGHTYSTDPGKRLIIINNRILREGDNIQSGLTLKNITWDGVILHSQGTSFQITVSR